ASLPVAIVAAGPFPPGAAAACYRVASAQSTADPAFHRCGDIGRYAGPTHAGSDCLLDLCAADPGAWRSGNLLWREHRLDGKQQSPRRPRAVLPAPGYVFPQPADARRND